MREIWSRHPEDSYAEVNSYQRYFVPSLQEFFGVAVAAIVRDGKYVVRYSLLPYEVEVNRSTDVCQMMCEDTDEALYQPSGTYRDWDEMYAYRSSICRSS